MPGRIEEIRWRREQCPRAPSWKAGLLASVQAGPLTLACSYPLGDRVSFCKMSHAAGKYESGGLYLGISEPHVQPGPPPAEHLIPNNKRQAGLPQRGYKAREGGG